jgi:hypothetical protein
MKKDKNNFKINEDLEYSSSWEANSHSACLEILGPLWNVLFITVFTKAHQWFLSCAR